MTNPERIFVYNTKSSLKGPVIYWMSREQRVDDNWALVYATEIAKEMNADLAVIFCLTPTYPGANLRHFGFLLKGLEKVEKNLSDRNIPFFLLHGDSTNVIHSFIKEYKAGVIITDFDPLRIKLKWKERIASKIDIPLIEVDAHNIVPCRKVSGKAEFGAYTIRPKIKKMLPDFMDAFPKIPELKKQSTFSPPHINWEDELIHIEPDRTIAPVNWLKPGENAAKEVLSVFLDKIDLYNENRNNPNLDATSNLSPYFHFGHIAPQRVAIEVTKLPQNDNTMAFLEEMIIRRELSDNYCLFNPLYDQFEGFPEWAKKSLNEHRKDEREFIYDDKDLEHGRTHDPLWNAAQNEMVSKGKMHGYLRMYWAKKILEWTASPEDALRISIYLNDRYEIDGRDPNGYVGCAWSIGGVHDRAWQERPVFGKIRYMNFNGCKRKFDVETYIQNNRKPSQE